MRSFGVEEKETFQVRFRMCHPVATRAGGNAEEKRPGSATSQKPKAVSGAMDNGTL